nr:SGNH/GDSL hydrolase family protein [Nocardioides flavescens]
MIAPVVAALLVVSGCGATDAGGPAASDPSPAASSAAPSSSSESTVPSSAPDSRARRTALFFGDSYFVGGGCSPDASQDMAAVAGAQLGYRTVIRGAGGTGFVTANPEYGIPAYLEQIAQGAFDVPGRAPSLVVIEGGSNDYGQPTATIRRNAGKILRIAARDFPGALVVLVGPMQTYGQLSQSEPIKRTLRSLARKRGVPFVNMQRWVYGQDGLLCSDYDHPTYATHQALGQRLAQALAKRGA